ncbi:MAG: hypothetical protein JWO92_1123 [Chitinophagaceae bacterium]|nr:hypothetical protein [Chitinophagaceae bacterium]
MKKEDREIVFNKYAGRCAYCGCELQKGWHVDELEPVRRNRKWIPAHWGEGLKETAECNSDTHPDTIFRKWNDGKWVADGCKHPENFNIDNQNPACASCNINKHSMSLEQFRESIQQYVQSLNLYSVQYKIAKRYGLIEEINKPVVFYFETIKPLL